MIEFDRASRNQTDFLWSARHFPFGIESAKTLFCRGMSAMLTLDLIICDSGRLVKQRILVG